jgi:hypothetical protein
MGLSGFGVDFVRWHVGFLGLPDKSPAHGINKLGAKCRVCQVFIGVESLGELGANQNRNGATPG